MGLKRGKKPRHRNFEILGPGPVHINKDLGGIRRIGGEDSVKHGILIGGHHQTQAMPNSSWGPWPSLASN